MVNEQQTKFWSGTGGEYWVANQQQMDNMLSPLGDKALEKLDLTTVTHLLDVGCGTGTTTLDIGAAVPDGGRVTGADLSVPMTEYARERATQQGVANVDFMQCDVQADPFDAQAFDAAFSRFGVMFFDKPVLGLSNIHKALKPSSQFAFVCWQAPNKNLWHSLALEIAKKYIDIPTPPSPQAPGPFAFADKDYLASIISSAGFSDITIEQHEQEIELFAGMGIRDTAENYARINPAIANFVGDADEAAVMALIDNLAEGLSAFHDGHSLRLPSATWIVCARS
ncbi:class I SAM-dependent methyltransferase [Alphaproteobacteria bacterium]|nr:class I SAM-dependent methyltransferase [Alphaproteobacteria bacterium]